MAASRDGDDAIPRRQIRRDVIEHVRGVAQAGEKQQGRAGATPVEDFQAHAVLDRDERNRMRRRVPPIVGMR